MYAVGSAGQHGLDQEGRNEHRQGVAQHQKHQSERGVPSRLPHQGLALGQGGGADSKHSQACRHKQALV